MKNRFVVLTFALLIFGSTGGFANHHNRPRSTFSVRKAISERASLRANYPKLDATAMLNAQNNSDAEKTQNAISRGISVVERVATLLQSLGGK
jgi:hypothetical protein